MNAIKFMTRFHAIEERLDLFRDVAAGPHWWEAVRYQVHAAVFRQLSGLAAVTPSRPPPGRRLFGRLARLGLTAGLRLRLLSRGYDVIVFRAARQRRHGRPYDPALDALAAVCPGRQLVIDTYPHCHHRAVRVRPRSGMPREPAALARFCDEAETEFGVGLDRTALSGIVCAGLAAFEQARRDYRTLFTRVRPRFVLLSQNGIESGLFVAARELDIPVVEVQHGLINHAHPAYSFPRSISAAEAGAVPSHFVTFSDYWRHACHYPAGEVVTLGNDDFFVAPLPPGPPPGEVLFVGADIYHPTLGPLLAEIAARLPRRRFTYKLHPNQQPDFESIRAWFAAWPNIEVVAGHVPAQALLAAAEVVVVVQSTVVHEALQGCRRVCIVPVLNYQIHEDLFALPSVALTADAAALERAIETAPAEPGPSPMFFDRFNAPRARALLDGLLTSSRGAPRAASARGSGGRAGSGESGGRGAEPGDLPRLRGDGSGAS